AHHPDQSADSPAVQTGCFEREAKAVPELEEQRPAPCTSSAACTHTPPEQHAERTSSYLPVVLRARISVIVAIGGRGAADPVHDDADIRIRPLCEALVSPPQTAPCTHAVAGNQQ